MRTLTSIRRLAVLAFLGVSTTLWASCAEQSLDPLEGPALGQAGQLGDPGIERAIAVQERHTPQLLRSPRVVGTAVGLNSAGKPVIQVFVTSATAGGVPDVLDGIPVERKVTGLFRTGSNPTTRARPAPVGFSVGHPAITAGTIGARVKDASGKVYVLSNNHVLANINDAQIGDPIYQPGPYDGGTPADQIATLSMFEPIDFSSNGVNTIDAAIALSSTADLSNSTPLDDAYGVPNAQIVNDTNGDGWFDDLASLLGLTVQKYGRTTELTSGEITGINATVEICYEVLYVFCIRSAVFVDQLIVEPGSFSAGGDSGSLLVTGNSDKQPVALLFAGSSTQTIANRIDRVLQRFNVSIDGAPSEPPPPPDPVTDVAVSAFVAPPTAVQGTMVDVSVTVDNVGSVDVATAFDVTVVDVTDGTPIGTEHLNGLPAGADTSITFVWNTVDATLGSHSLVASHDLSSRIPDEADASNDSGSTTSTVTDPAALDNIHIGDLDGLTFKNGKTWTAAVDITVHDANDNPINGATVRGVWNPASVGGALPPTDQCTTGDGGGNGTCALYFFNLPSKQRIVSFTVTDVSMPDKTYDAAANHDADGDSDGTSVEVKK